MEEYKRLSDGERSYFHALAREENSSWIKSQLREHEAGWLVVVDGRVIAHGRSLDDYPDEAEIRRICKKTGQFVVSPNMSNSMQRAALYTSALDFGAYLLIATTCSALNVPKAIFRGFVKCSRC